MKKHLTIFLLAIFGTLLILPSQSQAEFKLFATKVELSGTVKLVWTKPAGANNTTQYELYRSFLPDSAVKIHTTSDTFFVDQVPTQFNSVVRSFAYRVVAKTGAVVELSNTIFVSVPNVPLIGSFRLEGKKEQQKVNLLWQKPPVGTVSYYLVFRGIAGDNGPTHQQIDSTTNQWSITDAPQVFNPDHPVSFVFYVKAKLTTGEILVSTTLQITLHGHSNRDQLKFVSIPPLYGQLGKKYEYTAKAVSSDPTAVIRYSWSFPATQTLGFSFSVDSVTGTVNWTPNAKGIFRVAIIARSNKGGMIKQEFAVAVVNGNGVIQGKVTDTLNNPIPNAIVELFKTQNDFFTSYSYAVKTDMNGNYKIGRVDPGNYKLKVNSPSAKYQSQWYDGKRDPSQANIITVQDSPAVAIANVTLRGGAANFPKVTVSGSVTDTLGLSINNGTTRVVFVRAEFALNVGPGGNITTENFRRLFEMYMHGDLRLEGNSEHVVKALVDSNGAYSVKLHPGAYIAFARSAGYSVEFFNQKADLLSADVIRIHKDTSGIQFSLAPLPPVVLGGISGSVSDSVNDVPVPARVMAIRDGWRYLDPHPSARVYVTDTDSTGAYSFSDLLPGTYVVMAVPLGDYAPSFYVSENVSIYRWNRAGKVVVNGNTVDNINIYVRKLGPFNSGYTNINGTVSMTGPGASAGRSGVLVYAYRNNEIAGYAMTDVNGNYTISGLSPGYFLVFADKIGFNETTALEVNVGYDVTGSPTGATVNFTMNSTTMSVQPKGSVQPTEYSLSQNFPNPFNPSTSITYSVPAAGNVSLKVYNIVGQEVATLVNGVHAAGEYRAAFNASSLSSGVYFYRLEAGSTAIVKKMMLLK